jgi:uncharacterized protein (DUF1778 family)
MSASVDSSGKIERIELRVTSNAKALLAAAAQMRHTTVSEFLLTHGIAAAEQAVAAPNIFYATETGWAAIQKLLDEDDRPSPETISWLTKHG